MKSHTHEIRFPVFSDFQIFITFTDDVRAEAKALGKTVSDQCGGFTITSNSGICYMVLPHRVKAGVIAHEAYHAVSACMKWVNARREEEVYAYHIGYVVAAITGWSKGKYA